MKNYKVVFEIEINAASPLEAAKKVQNWLQNENDNWQYYVQETNRKNAKIVSVDLDENDESAVLPADNYEPLIKNQIK